MRCVILASGSGTLAQAVLDTPGVEVVAVGSDRPGAGVLDRASRVGVPTFLCPLARGGDRGEWNRELADQIAGYGPDWVVSAGFMRILGPEFLARFPSRVLNTHPALLPAFPGAHAVADALDAGVKVTGSTIHLVDEGVDTGPVIAQAPVAVREDDTTDTLHERIRAVERAQLSRLLAFLGTGELRIEGRRVTGFHANDF